MLNSKALILYIPVIHRRYQEIILEWARRAELICLYVVGKEMLESHNPIAHEIRALDPETVVDIIKSARWLPPHKVDILDPKNVFAIRKYCDSIVTAREAITMGLAKRYFPAMPVAYIDTFLRWDETRVVTTRAPAHHKASTEPEHLRLMAMAENSGAESSDWWRRVGVVIVDPNTLSPIVLAHNEHMPSEYAPYIAGDPRDVIPTGQSPEIAGSIHAEKNAVARAAASGFKTSGTWIFTSTFPCSDCARVIVKAGIQKVFYRGGCSNLDGDAILHSSGIEIVHVPDVSS